MNDEIAELQRRLAEVQTSASKKNLSERNCVELVRHLISKGMIEVLYTIDGKEYVTKDKLEREITNEILAEGRIEVSDISRRLNIPLGQIEVTLARLLAQDKTLIQKLGSQAVSQQFLDSLAEEVNDLLQQEGQLDTTRIAMTFGIPMEHVTEFLRSRMAKGIIKGNLKENAIYTRAYIDSEKAQIRGVFSAITTPIMLAEIQARYGFDDGIFESTVNELIREKRLNGTIIREAYVPTIYEEAQKASIRAYYEQNGYIDYDRVMQMMWTNTKKAGVISFLRKNLSSTAIFLENAAVNERMRDNLDASIDSAMMNEQYFNLMDIVPPHFSYEDAATLMNMCPCMKVWKDRTMLLDEHFLVTKALLSDMLKSFEERAARDMQRELIAIKSKSITTTTTTTTTPASSTAAKSKGSGAMTTTTKPPLSAPAKGKGRKQQHQHHHHNRADEDDEDEDEAFSTTSRGRGSSRKKRQGGSRSSAAADPFAEMVERILPSEEELRTFADRAFSNEAEGTVLDELVQQHLRPQLKEMYLALKDSIFTDSSTDRKKKHKEHEQLINQLYYDIQLHAKAIQQSFRGRAALLLDQYLLKTLCTHLLEVIIKDQALHHNIDDEELETTNSNSNNNNNNKNKNKNNGRMDAATIQRIIAELPTDVAKALTKLVATTKKTVNDFLAQFQVVQTECHIYLRDLDKKREKAMIAAKKHELKSKLQQAEPEINASMGEVLLLAMLCLLAQRRSVIVHASTNMTPLLFEYLKRMLLWSPPPAEEAEEGSSSNKAKAKAKANQRLYVHLKTCQTLVKEYIAWQHQQQRLEQQEEEEEELTHQDNDDDDDDGDSDDGATIDDNDAFADQDDDNDDGHHQEEGALLEDSELQEALAAAHAATAVGCNVTATTTTTTSCSSSATTSASSFNQQELLMSTLRKLKEAVLREM